MFGTKDNSNSPDSGLLRASPVPFNHAVQSVSQWGGAFVMGLMVLNASETFPLAMSSREIAELTGKKHGHVLRDIRKMLKNLYHLDDKPKLDQLQIQGVTIEKE